MPIISKIKAEEVFDSRGNPTIAVLCELENGAIGSSKVPSGASTGENEAYELRDGDPNKYNGKGILKAIENVNEEIANAIVGKEWTQETLDQALIELDGTENKKRLGANAILGISMAFARSSSKEEGVELYEYLAKLYFKNKKEEYRIPKPAFNIINGGKHSDSELAFQEFMIIPETFEGVEEKVEVAKKIVESLKDILIKDGQEITVGDEGGFAPKFSTNEKALNYIENAIVEAGYNTEQVKFGLDVAGSTFYKQEKYYFEDKILNPDEMLKVYEDLCMRYEIISIEDPYDEKDFESFAKINKKLGEKINIVGDDLTVTNTKLIQKAIERNSINTLLVKPNQIGTITETLNAIRLAKENNIKTFISHRSGETDDTFISDLAVGVRADYIKAGAPTKSERIVKYDRLIEIEKQLN